MAEKRRTTKKRGRPPVAPELRKRNNVTIRLRDQLKASLESDAQENGRSLSEEIEARLERSLEEQREADRIIQFVHDDFGGKQAYDYMSLLATFARGLFGDDWHTTPDQRRISLGAWHGLIDFRENPDAPLAARPVLFDLFYPDPARDKPELLREGGRAEAVKWLKTAFERLSSGEG